MSDYVREKVLRLPLQQEDIDKILIKFNAKDLWDLYNVAPDLFDYRKDRKFQKAPTISNFLDYVLDSDYGEDCGDWGKTRALTENEKTKYKSIFEQVLSDVDINKVRLVEFCWYNCSEAPDYYDEINDNFYYEV